MVDETKDVISEPSPEEQQVVNEPEETTPQETEQISGEQETSQPQEVKPEVTQPDRPEINYAMEALRKVNELTDAFSQFKTGYQTQSQQEQPQYTKAQLQAYLQESNLVPQQKIWALEEVDKIEKLERKQEMEGMFNQYTQKTQGDIQRRQSYQWFATAFPECFIRDNAGNVMSVNNNHPLVQKVNEYMGIKEFKNSPRGLEGAVKMAAFDLGFTMNKQMQNKVNRTTAQLRKEQKKTLIASGGVSPAQESSKAKQIATLVKKYQETRDPEIFKQLAKLRGLVPSG